MRAFQIEVPTAVAFFNINSRGYFIFFQFDKLKILKKCKFYKSGARNTDIHSLSTRKHDKHGLGFEKKHSNRKLSLWNFDMSVERRSNSVRRARSDASLKSKRVNCSSCASDKEPDVHNKCIEREWYAERCC